MERNIPNDLRKKLLAYVEFHYAKSRQNYGSHLDIPNSLKLRVAKAQYSQVGSGENSRNLNQKTKH